MMTPATVIRLRIEVRAHCCMLPSSTSGRLSDDAVELVLDTKSGEEVVEDTAVRSDEPGVEVVKDGALRSDDVEEDEGSRCIVVVLSSSMTTLGADMLATETVKLPDSMNVCSMYIMTTLTSLVLLEASTA